MKERPEVKVVSDIIKVIDHIVAELQGVVGTEAGKGQGGRSGFDGLFRWSDTYQVRSGTCT